MLGHDDEVLRGIARLLAPGGTARALVSVVPRDGVPAIRPRLELSAAYSRCGLALTDLQPAGAEEVANSGSSWAKRLRAPLDRPVTRMAITLDRKEPSWVSR